jgi:hypothetical protein
LSNAQEPNSSDKKPLTWEDRIVAFVMIAPFFLVFIGYVVWVIHNGGDPTDHPAPLRANITGDLLTFKNILGIFVNGAFHAIIAGIFGVLVGSMYSVTRSFMGPPAPYEVTVDDLIRRLEQAKAEIGGDAKVAVSSGPSGRGGMWPFRLSHLRNGQLTTLSSTDTSPALIINT